MSWELKNLKDVCEVIMGQAPPGTSYNENGVGLSLIAGAGDFGELTPEPKKHTTQAARKSKVNDLILCIRATIGDLNWSDKIYCLGRGVAGLRPKEEHLNKDYLWHFINANKEQLASKGTGSTFKQVSRTHIDEWQIPVPPLAEQKRIAAILDKADAIRRKRQQAIQLADEFLRSVFLDMFGDPVTNPKSWEVKKWSQVLNIVNGRNQKAVEDENGSYPICGSGGFMAKANDWLTEKNSVIIGRKGNINKPILMKERFWNVDTAFGLEPSRALLSHNYLFWFCKFYDFERHNKAVTIPSLTKADLLEVEIPLPAISLQKKFDEAVASIERLVEKEKNSTQLKMFESLSQQAFKGEL